MKSIKKIASFLLLLLFIYSEYTTAQEAKKETYKPVFITVTKAHRSSNPDINFSDWLKTEQQYFNNVTKKNNLIIASGVYFHYFTPDDTEINFVNVYQSWEDIEKANDENSKLAKATWPDKKERDDFFKKQNSYYSPIHSDEIYLSTKFSKPLEKMPDKPLITYVKVNHMNFNSGGSGFEEFFNNVTLKNKYIKGYYTHRHLWGADSRDFVEVYMVEKFEDIEKMFEENSKLINEHWPDKEKRTAFFEKFNKIFSGHGDLILTNVPELAK